LRDLQFARSTLSENFRTVESSGILGDPHSEGASPWYSWCYTTKKSL
jgi:hypothetical protein